MISYGINDYFYDIVFGIEINNNTYDFKNGKFIHNSKKYIYFIINFMINLLILFFCIFFLIFVEIPIIKNKKIPQNKSGRYTKFKEKIENNEEQFDINERFTAEPV